MINTLSGIMPFTLMGFLLAGMLCFLQWLHGMSVAWYGMVFFAAGVCVSVLLWCWQLFSVQDSPLRHRKLSTAIWLSALLAFAFSMTFIMIFMYYWLNEDGHVHGASSSSGSVAVGQDRLGQSGVAAIFVDVQLKGYRLPITAVMQKSSLSVQSDRSQPVMINVTNRSNQPITLRFLAKIAPSEAKPFVHYAPMHHEQMITIAANATQAITHTLTLSESLPLALQPFSVTHFLMGPDDGSAWKKMQGDLTLING